MSIPNRFIPSIRLDITPKVQETISGVPVDITITMVDPILAFNAVTSNGRQADSANSAHRDRIAGIALQDIGAGFSGLVRVEGEVFNPLWGWTAGDIIFLNGTALSNIAPATGFVQILATAKDSFTIILQREISILL